MIGLGRGEQDAFHPPPAQKPGQPAVAARPKRPQHIGHRAAQILHRLRPLMDGAQHIDQHDLAIHLGEMIAEKRLHDLGLVPLIPPRHLAPQRRAARFGRLRQGRKGQHGRACQITRQQEPPRRAVRPTRRPRRRQIGGKGLGQRLRLALVQPQRTILGPGQRHEPLRLAPLGDAVQRRLGPFGIGLVQQAQIQQPFARIIDNIQMHDTRPRQSAKEPRRPNPERQAQFGHGARRLRPVRVGAGQGGQMILERKARQGQIGLRLQIGRVNPPRGCRAQLRHPPALQQVGDQPGDEHGLARPRQARDPQAHHRFEHR